MLKSFAPRVGLFGTLIAVLLIDAGCVDHRCPRGYDQRGDTCYRIKDAGLDGAATDASDEEEELEDAALPATAADAQGVQQDARTDPQPDAAESLPPSSDADAADADAGVVDAAADATIEPEVDGSSQAVACEDAARDCVHLNAPSCQEKYCTSQSTCALRPHAGLVNHACDNNVCNASGACVQCTPDTQRSQCAASQDCDPKTFTCKARCRNGVVDEDEDCEIGVGGWTTANCGLDCRQSLYDGNTMFGGVCVFTPTPDEPLWGRGSCPDLPGFIEGCFRIIGYYCNITCSDTLDCPIGQVCSPHTLGDGTIGLCRPSS